MYVGAVEEMMCVVCVDVTQHSGDGCVLASTFCKYDLRKGDLFVLSWAMVRRVRRGNLSSELLMCGGGVRSILLLLLVTRCQETIDVCMWRMFVFMSEAWSCRCSCMESVSVLSCRCCMVVSCVLCASCGSSPCCVLHDLQSRMQ